MEIAWGRGRRAAAEARAPRLRLWDFPRCCRCVSSAGQGVPFGVACLNHPVVEAGGEPSMSHRVAALLRNLLGAGALPVHGLAPDITGSPSAASVQLMDNPEPKAISAIDHGANSVRCGVPPGECYRRSIACRCSPNRRRSPLSPNAPVLRRARRALNRAPASRTQHRSANLQSVPSTDIWPRDRAPRAEGLSARPVWAARREPVLSAPHKSA